MKRLPFLLRYSPRMSSPPVEQPLIYLKDVGSYPLSVFLASRYTENLPLQFVCCVLSLLPLALCFFYCGGDVLDSGIPKEEKA